MDTRQVQCRDILTRYRNALLAQFPDELQCLILFGSQARGDATPESDIDVLVVVNWEETVLSDGFYVAPLSDPRWRLIMDIAYDISLDYDVVLAPFVMSMQRFQEWSPLGAQVRHEGIEVWRKN